MVELEVYELLDRFVAMGGSIELEGSGDTIVFRAPKRTITERWKDDLAAVKPDLLRILRGTRTGRWPGIFEHEQLTDVQVHMLRLAAFDYTEGRGISPRSRIGREFPREQWEWLADAGLLRSRLGGNLSLTDRGARMVQNRQFEDYERREKERMDRNPLLRVAFAMGARVIEGE